jgi:hypothetical protein
MAPANLLAVPAPALPIRPSSQRMFDIPGVTFTPTGLIITRGLKIDQWVELGKRLRGGGDALRIWVGDWISYGRHEYGKKYQPALALTGYKEGTLRNSVWVANKVPLSLRSDNLTFKHYQTVASLPTQVAIKKWLLLAAEKHWSAARLYREMTNTARTVGPGGALSPSPALISLKERVVREELGAKILELRRWLETPCDAVLSILYHRTLEIFEWQRDRTVEGDCWAILKLFSGELGTESPERASDGDISAWLHGRSFIMDEEDVDQRLALMVRLKMLTIEEREESRKEGQKGPVPSVYAAERDYFSDLEEMADLPATERERALRRDWKQRIERYAPELIPRGGWPKA